MTRFSIAVAVFVLAGNVLAQESKEAKGAAALQGTWVVSSINGQSAPEGSPEMTLTFTGDKYSQAVGGEINERGTVKIDASMTPMTIDLTIVEGPDAGKIQLGIVEITGPALRASLDTPGAQQRPKDFTITEGSIMFVGKKKG